MKRLALALLVAGAASVVPAAPEARAKMFKLADDGSRGADIAVDPAGTAHIAWTTDTPGDAPEFIVYCRVPRGATRCMKTAQFPHRDPVTHGAQVVLSRDGSELWLINVWGDTKYGIHSPDGGETFEAPVALASPDSLSWFDATLGPGDFSISLTGIGHPTCLLCDAGYFQVSPVDGETTTGFGLGEDATAPSVGFPDPTSPIIVYSNEGGPVLRVWNGSGDYNDLGNWSPEIATEAAGDLASGPRGVYVLHETGPYPWEYAVRRYNPLRRSFGLPTQITRTGRYENAPSDGSLEQDEEGNLHAIFVKHGDNVPSELQRRVSTDGGLNWRRAEVLAAEVGHLVLGHPVAGAAPDGGGAVVFHDDLNARGPVYFAPFDPVGGGGADCPPLVKVGRTVVRAQEGCLKRDGKRYLATGAVKVNGVEILPRGGGGAAAAKFRVTVDKGKRTLRTNSPASVQAGNIVLERGAVAWRLPSGTGKVKRLAGDSSAFRDLGKYTKRLFEFPVDGDAELVIGKGEKAAIPANFRLPQLIGGISGAVTLRTDAGGLNLDGFKITAPAAKIGLLRIAGIDVTYEGQNRFRGSASLRLPLSYEPLNVAFGFRDGRLDYVHVDRPFSPPLPIVGAPPSPIVGLDELSFDYVDTPDSRRFTGGIDLIGGPKIFGFSAARLDGAVTLEFPASGHASVRASGDLSVVRLPFASGSATFVTTPSFSFEGSFVVPPGSFLSKIAQIGASVEGSVSLGNSKSFSASGDAFAQMGPFSFEGEAVISNKGAYACVKPIPIPLFDAVLPPPTGIKWDWGSPVPKLACGIGSFLPGPLGGSAKAAQGGHTVELDSGLPHAALEVSGEGGAPTVTVTAPNGEQVTSSADGPVLEGRFIAQELEEASKTYVSVAEPPAGGYSIEAEPGSPPITGVAHARGLPEPKIAGKLAGSTRRRTFSYRIRRLAGQRVTFVERSAGGLHRELATTSRRRGKLRFRPQPAPERKRRLVARVEQDGVPRAELTLARFKAPRLRPPAGPKRARARRKGARLVVSWSRVRRASGYEVEIRLPRDGRRLLRFTKKRKLTVRGVEANDKARVTIRAVGPDARAGKPARAQLKSRRVTRKRG